MFLVYKCLLGGGVDYISGEHTLIIPSGYQSIIFTVSIRDDNFCEGNENFNLTVVQSSLPSRFVLGSFSEVTVTIMDNDGE